MPTRVLCDDYWHPARTARAGRVGVLSPGHNVEVWLHPAFQTLIGNALRWCGHQNR
jgi:uncharacterized protein